MGQTEFVSSKHKVLLRVIAIVKMAPDSMKIALYGRSPDIGLFSTSASDRFAQTSTWLPGLMSQSAILWDSIGLRIKRITKGHKQIARQTL